MRRIGALLAFTYCLQISVPAWAELANCDGPATPEEAERRQMLKDADPTGVNPIYAAADGLLDACETAKKKINSALDSLSGATGPSSAGSQSEQTATPAAAQAPAPSAPRAPMSRNVARIERDRVAEMDGKAAALVQSNCGGFGCSSLLESTVDPVIRDAEALNANPEYLAHLPQYAPIASVQAAARFGWTRQDGYWVQAAPQPTPASADTSTLGAYLLSADECRKLHSRLDQTIKADPTKEPVELSFFEAECLQQLPDYLAAVAAWRQGFKGAAPQVAAVEAPSPVSSEGGTGLAQQQAASEALAAWNEEAIAETSGEAREIARRFNLPGGCYLYVYTYEDDPDFKAEVTWNGPCVAGEPVNGTGDFLLGGDIPYGDDYAAARIVNGRLEGGPYLKSVSGDGGPWWELHTFDGGCLAKNEHLGYTRDTLLKEEEMYQGWARMGVKGYQGKDFTGHVTSNYVLNRTYQGVKYYRHQSQAAGEMDTDQADQRCLAAFAKLR